MSYKTNKGEETDVLYILLPGVSQDIRTGMMSDISKKLTAAKKTWVAINYPFQDRGQKEPSSDDLVEEIDEVMSGLTAVHTELQNKQPKKIIIIAKSLGAVVVAKMQSRLFALAESVDLFVLGYVLEDISFTHNRLRTFVIYQGEHDRFMTPDHVTKFATGAEVITIKSADHSFRNENKEPIYESVVLADLYKRLSI